MKRMPVRFYEPLMHLHHVVFCDAAPRGTWAVFRWACSSPGGVTGAFSCSRRYDSPSVQLAIYVKLSRIIVVLEGWVIMCQVVGLRGFPA